MIHRFFTLSILILTLMACTARNTDLPARTLPVSQEMAAIQKSPHGLAWREDGIYALYDDHSLFRRDGQEWEQRTLPERTEPACRRTLYGSLFLLPNGELALSQACFSDYDDEHNIFVYDWGADSGYLLLPFDIVQAGSFASNPEMTHFIYQTFNSFGTMYRVKSHTLEPLPVTLTQGDRSWYLPDTVEAEQRWDADPARIDKRIYDVGLLANTKWSPDGKWIAVGATLEPAGKPLATLGYYNWNIYLIDPDTLESKVLIPNVADSGGIFGWSPDSRWLAYREGTYRGFLPRNDGRGVWIVNIETGTRHHIYRGQTGSSVWSPDGSEMLIEVCKVPICDEYELVILDLSSLVAEPLPE